jgi:hypothetical protein
MLGRSGALLVPSPGSARFPCSRDEACEHGFTSERREMLSTEEVPGNQQLFPKIHKSP